MAVGNNLTVAGTGTITGTLTATTVTSPASTAFTIKSAGTTAMTVDTSQNVGIGTASPVSKLHLSGTALEVRLQNTTATTGNTYTLASGNNGYFYISRPSVANCIVVDTNGNVGVGTDAPTAKVYAFTGTATAVGFRAGNSASYAEFQVDASGNSQLIAPGGVQIFNTNGAERMRLDSLGNLSIGTTGTLAKLTITAPNTSDILAVQTTATTGSPTGIVYKNGSGTIAGYVSINAASNTVTYTNSSDGRLKTNPRDFSGLDLVSQMKPKKYERICQLGTDEIGLYAQELAGILPEAVSIGDEDVNKKPWGIDYGRITPVLIKAIQELSAKNDALEARLAALETVQ